MLALEAREGHLSTKATCLRPRYSQLHIALSVALNLEASMLKNIDSLQQRLDVGCLRLPSFTINHRWQHSRPKQS